MMKPETHPPLRRVSECFVKPNRVPRESNQPYYLAPWDLAILSMHYIQNGILFLKHEHFMVHDLLQRLKISLSAVLFHFYPLFGRLTSIKNDDQGSVLVYVDCTNSPGAKFIHAALDVTISDILSPVHVPLLVQSLFDLNGDANLDGLTLPLLSIQLTELLDGVFLGCSFNHSIADDTSFWNFFGMWSEIFQSTSFDSDGIVSISRPPILTRWFPDGCDPILYLRLSDTDRFVTPELRERVFHFSAESIANLKAKTNAECGTTEISSFQSLSALVWRGITRARRIAENQNTYCMMASNNRGRLRPPISEDYFGNMVTVLTADAKAGELLETGLGWAAWKLHEAVTSNTNEKLRESLVEWVQCPNFYELRSFTDLCGVVMASSPRFNKYGSEFGMGKAVAVRCGFGNTFDGYVYWNPGSEGGGSMDLEIFLLPQTMAILESDSEFMAAVSFAASDNHIIGIKQPKITQKN